MAGPPWDALIDIHVKPHRFFIRDGQEIRLDLPVSLSEAVLGGPVEVPTPLGKVRMQIPKHSDSGTKLRLRGRGVAAHGKSAAAYAHSPTRSPRSRRKKSAVLLRCISPNMTIEPDSTSFGILLV
jgi:DnaJ-class molecular chaperone